MKTAVFARGLAALALGAFALAGGTNAWPQAHSCLERSQPVSQAVDFAAAAARQSPAVVSIMVTEGSGDRPVIGDARPSKPWDRGWARGFASGFIIGSDGYILTSAHAVSAPGRSSSSPPSSAVSMPRSWESIVSAMSRF